jgi:hypothetical protein
MISFYFALWYSSRQESTPEPHNFSFSVPESIKMMQLGNTANRFKNVIILLEKKHCFQNGSFMEYKSQKGKRSQLLQQIQEKHQQNIKRPCFQSYKTLFGEDNSK